MDEVREVAREEAENAVEPLWTILSGPKHPSGVGRVTTKGMEHKVDEMHGIIINGGRKKTRREKIDLALIRAAQAVTIAVIVKVF